MNYIPGFTNYLQASVPAYANGGRVDYNDPYAAQYMPAAEPSYVPGFTNYLETSVPPYVAPYQSTPAAQPMTQEAAPAAAPFDPSTFDFSGLDLSGLGGLNFSGFGGGRMGGVIQDPNIQYIKAPISNKGNPTGKMGGNVFAITPNQPVRLVDLNTKTIVFEGTGPEAARKATELGQSITDARGRKASYDIQTADPSGAYVTVANEKRNKSTLGTLGQIVGTALPIVVSLVPGLQFAGPVLSAAIAGGAGAAMAGRDPVKGAIMGGLSAGGGQVLGPALQGAGVGAKAAAALGTGIGSTAGGLATGQSLKSSLLGGVASGALSYVAPSIQDELGISTKSGSLFRGSTPSTSASTGGDTSASTGADAGTGGDIINVTGARVAPGTNLGGFKTPAQKYLRDARADDVINPETRTPYNTGYDGDLINVTGARVAPGTNLGGFTGNPAVDRLLQPTTELGDENLINVTGTRVVPGTNLGGFTGNPDVDRLLQPGAEELGDEDLIKVTGRRVVPGTNLGGFTTGNPDVDRLLQSKTELGDEDLIKVTGRKTIPSTGGLTLADAVLDDVAKKSAEEKAKEDEAKKKLDLAEALRLAALAAGLVDVGKGGGGSSGTYGGTGSGRLNPTFSAKLPAVGGLGNIGAARTPRALGDVDWLTYGTRPELRFFDYAPANPAPITTPVPGNPAGPIMDEENPRFAEGGAFAAKRGGPSRRTEFAVNGAGTGRSDDIPAVLSDGEYVIDAETVALLGDGSNKAGAKKLDELRIKVRKHKGRKLAKGRFSANAKRPEAYLSGGRI
jgi:hypothetical protein